MSVATTADLLDALRRYRLLDAGQLAEAGREVRGDARDLARELVRRGWLTPYQVNQLFQGRGGGLALGSYVLLDKLGEGGMGAVFKARHAKLGRTVALKVIRSERLGSEAVVKRFRREIMAAAALNHPNIVLAYDADEAGGTHFFAMEFVEGTDLAKVVKARGQLPVGEACDYVRQAALGLQHAHERGMVHRDVKPANLLLTAGSVVKVLDMGLARVDALTESESVSTLTQEGAVMGTPDYMAPEQALRSHDVDTRADLYSLGCTLFFLLTGRVPFAGGSATEKLLRRQVEPAPDVRSRRPDVPEAVAALVAKLMARRPEERYQTPAELALALGEVLRGRPDTDPDGGSAAERTLPDRAGDPFADIDVPSGDRTAGLPPAGPRRAARKPLVLAAVGGLLLAGALAAVLWPGAGKPPAGEADTSAAHGPAQQEPAAEVERKRRAEADEALGPLAEKAADPRTTFAEFAGDVAAFKAKYGGTPPAIRAAELLMKLPSPLDGLDPAKISEDARAAWKAEGFNAKDVVAVLGQHRQRHWGAVSCIAANPNGKTIATGGADAVVRLWGAETGGPLGVIPSPKGVVISLAFNTDGSLLAIGGESMVRVWDLSAGKDRAPPQTVPGHVTSFVFEAGGKSLLVGYEGGAVHRWDLGKGQTQGLSEPKEGQEAGVLALSPDGTRFALGYWHQPEGLKLWDLGKNRELPPLKAETFYVSQLKFSPDGKLLLSLSTNTPNNFPVRVWEVAGGRELRSLAGSRRCMAFHPSGDTVATGGDENTIRVWDVHTGEERRRFAGPPAGVDLLEYTGDGRRLISGSTDGTIRLWDVDGGKEVQPPTGHGGPVNSLAFSPDCRRLLTGSRTPGMALWDVQSGTMLHRFDRDANEVYSVAFSPDGTHALSARSDDKVRLYDVETEKEVTAFEHRGSTVAFSPDGNSIISGGTGGGAECLWLQGAKTGQVLHRLVGHAGQVYSVAFSPDGRRALSGGRNDKTLILWDVTTGREVRRFTGHTGAVWSCAFSPDGRFVLSGGGDKTVRLWDLGAPLGKEPKVFEGHAGGVIATFASDGKTFAAASDNGQVIVWDAASGKRLREWQFPGWVHAVAFAADGRHLAVANANGTVYIFRLADGPPKS